MIFQKNFLFFKSLRVLYQHEDLAVITNKEKWDYITIISYEDFGLDKKGFDVVHKKISNIYLDKTEDEILNNFARNTRQEIQKTYTISDLKFTIDDSNIKETFALYKEFESAQGRKPWKIDSFKGVKLFNAYYKGQLIAAVPCYDIFPYLQVRAIFSKRLTSADAEMQKIIGYATRRLVFEACKFGKEGGYRFVGLGSVNESTSQKANVAQFKMFFGGKIEDEYTYVYRSSRFLFLQKIMRFFK